MKQTLYWLFFWVNISLFIFGLWGVYVVGTFEAWLTMITAFCGIFWCYWGLHSKKTDYEIRDNPHLIKRWGLSIASFFPVLLVVFILRSFLFEPFRIPSGSMLPTLHIGDFVLVNKFSYGMRLPITGNVVIGDGKPLRGDVVVFRYPNQPEIDYIKRVIGIPGDEIAIQGGRVYLNGQLQKLEHIGLYQGSQQHLVGARAFLAEENIEGHEHHIVNAVHSNNKNARSEYVVPDNSYFVMGDNRDFSHDSRYWGFVPEQNLKGRAFFIWLNWGEHFDYSRIGTTIQ